jgi:hypothetical protein
MSGAHGTLSRFSIVFSLASWALRFRLGMPEMKCAASPGGTFESHFMFGAPVGQLRGLVRPRHKLAVSGCHKRALAGENEGVMHIREIPTLARESRHIVVL